MSSHISTSSKRTPPFNGSYNLSIKETTVLLPQLDGPTSAIVCPALTDIDKSCNTLTSGRVG